MRLQIVSDTHFEFDASFEGLYGQPMPRVDISPQADALILAGDIGRFDQVLEFFTDPPIPVFYVPGNHDYYGQDIQDARALMFGAAVSRGIIMLDNHVHVLDGCRFVGSTLWTDYAINGDQEAGLSLAQAKMPCHRCIYNGDRMFSARNALQEHEAAVEFLSDVLNSPFDGKTIVISHHLPHPGSIHKRYAGSPMNAAFASDLTRLVERADMWVHGHTHSSFDYRVGGCRVVANPRGYPHDAENLNGFTFENPDYSPSLIVEV